MAFQPLRYVLAVDALFFICLIYRTIANPVGAMFANPLLTKDKALIPEVRILQAACFLLLFLIRFHTVLNIHSKEAYRLTLWSLIIEFLTILCFSVHVRGYTITATFQNPKLYIPFAIIGLLFLWMNVSYRYYLLTPATTSQKKNK